MAVQVGKAAAITFLFHAPSVAVACLHQAAAVKENPCVQSIQAPSKKRRLTEGLEEAVFFKLQKPAAAMRYQAFLKQFPAFDDDNG